MELEFFQRFGSIGMCQVLPNFADFQSQLCLENQRWEAVVLPRLGASQHERVKSRRREWTDKEDSILRHLVEQAAQPISWGSIAKHLPGRSRAQCRSHWLNCLDPQLLYERPWTKEEDRLVLKGVQRFGAAWTKIARSVKRPAPQIRTRYFLLQEELILDYAHSPK